jgi:formamidopyrimidine-DNA glycosylase
MPELPEVEVTTRKLRPLLKGKRILGFWTDWPKGMNVPGGISVLSDIKGRKIKSLKRRGKTILIYLSGGRLLAFHQKMSGKVLVLPQNFKDKHIHFRFKLRGGKELVLHDVRKFGRVWYGKETEVLAEKFFAKLGKEPLDISQGEFIKMVSWHKGMIKPLLLRQDIFSGIGNIVADESLWKAKIHPAAKIKELSQNELKRLFSAIQFVLKKSIRLGGSTMRDWLHPDGTQGKYYENRYVYARKDQPCPRCKTKIRKIIVGSRGTYFCPKCQ